MLKERLSKLQKWILKNCYHEKNGQIIKGMRKEDVFRYFKNTYFIGSQELVIPRNFKGFMSRNDYNKAHATISRSLRGLRDKGYVRLIAKKRVEQPDYDSMIQLAEKYKTKEELHVAMEGKGLGEIMGMMSGATKKIDIAVEVAKEDKFNTIKVVELTDKGVEKAKELLMLSS